MISETKAHGERKHHDKSPSSLQLREVCMGWQNRDETNEAALAGTLQHEAADSGDHSNLTDEQSLAVIECNEYVAQIAAFLGPKALQLREEYLPVDKEITTAGYLDRGLVNEDRTEAHVVDFKFGLNEVEPAINNLQGIAYGLGLVFLYPTVERFHVHFLMPYIADGKVSTATFEKKDFPRLLLRIRTVVARSRHADKIFVEAEKADSPEARAAILSKLDLNPTDGGCLFCNRKAVCPALNEMALVPSQKYQALQIPDVINPALITDSLDAAKALRFFAVMEGLAKDYRAAATKKALNEDDWIPAGYLLTKVERRSVLDRTAFRKVLEEHGFKQEDIDKCTEFTLGPAEKIISERAPRGEKTKAVEAFGEALTKAGATLLSEPIPVLKQAKVAKKLTE